MASGSIAEQPNRATLLVLSKSVLDLSRRCARCFQPPARAAARCPPRPATAAQGSNRPTPAATRGALWPGCWRLGAAMFGANGEPKGQIS